MKTLLLFGINLIKIINKTTQKRGKKTTKADHKKKRGEGKWAAKNARKSIKIPE